MTGSSANRKLGREIGLAWDDKTDDAAWPKAARDGGPQVAATPPHPALGLSDEDVVAMYRQVLVARAVDERMWLMQRAGKIAFIISVQGHEVAQVGISWPLRKGHDWMAPFYRSIAAAMTFGMTPEDIITAHLAKGDDISSGGRQMPGHYGAAPHNILSVSSPVGTQVLHAVGLALGAWVRGDDTVAITQFGEGTANQGEVHEAMNFAGVHKLPVIFVCENNGYAISVPLERQVGGGSIAARAAGYGFPGVQVDGGDLLACYAVGREAYERARTGGGPTLIEAHVVRLTSHSSDDDQRRYRDAADVEALKGLDPIPRLAASLREWGLLDESADEALRAEVKTLVAEAAARAEAHPEPDPATILRHVYADGT
jgi:2-oxoisovalerate dehydrogenase E1 component alpha subunit